MKFCTVDYVYRDCCLMFVEYIIAVVLFGNDKGLPGGPEGNTKRDENNNIITQYCHIHDISFYALRPVDHVDG